MHQRNNPICTETPLKPPNRCNAVELWQDIQMKPGDNRILHKVPVSN